MITPEISVVVPCHNSINTLDMCFASLQAQSFSKPYEIVFVDDASEDGTFDKIQKFHSLYPDCVSVSVSSGRGAWAARKTGIEVARADLIAFLDSDDEAYPYFLEKLYFSIMDTESDLVVCGFERVCVDDGVVLSREFCNEREVLSIKDDPGGLISLNPAPWNKLFKKDCLSAVFSFPHSPVMFDDLCLLTLALADIDKVSFVGRPLVRYYVSSNSTINSLDLAQVMDGGHALKTATEYAIARVDHSVNQLYDEAFSALAFIHLGISMMLRLSMNGMLDREASKKIRKFLDAYYSRWRASRYLKPAYCLSHRGFYLKALCSCYLYKLGLLGLCLKVYHLITDILEFDIKW